MSSLRLMSHAGLPVVAEIVRSGFVEGHHYGSIVALAADGTVDWSVGEVAAPVLPRSSNKPIQALAMVELGLDLDAVRIRRTLRDALRLCRGEGREARV